MYVSFLILLSMLFCHIIDDYKIQGILSSLKQRDWWIKNAPGKLYKHDYIMALIEHSFCWTFSIHLPILIYSLVSANSIVCAYIVTFLLNVICHAITDDLKANKKKINLIVDQFIHLGQIILTWSCYMIIMKGFPI